MTRLIDIAGHLAMIRHTIDQSTLIDKPALQIVVETQADAGVAGLETLLLDKERGDSVFRNFGNGAFGDFARTEYLQQLINDYLTLTDGEMPAPTDAAILATNWTATAADTVDPIDLLGLEYVD